MAVSTTGNTSANDFTIVWETELSAKAQGQWYYYDVDLRDYQGQDIYVAIVHFNCSNQFMLNIDDVMLYRAYNQAAENNATLSVYPNPATDIMKVESTQTVGSYEVYDITGAKVISNEPNAKAFTLDLRDLPSGTYLLKTVTKGSTQTQRIVKE